MGVDRVFILLFGDFSLEELVVELPTLEVVNEHLDGLRATLAVLEDSSCEEVDKDCQQFQLVSEGKVRSQVRILVFE